MLCINTSLISELKLHFISLSIHTCLSNVYIYYLLTLVLVELLFIEEKMRRHLCVHSAREFNIGHGLAVSKQLWSRTLSYRATGIYEINTILGIAFAQSEMYLSFP